jgi:transcriptional regulator with XRE-family HTH domain
MAGRVRTPPQRRKRPQGGRYDERIIGRRINQRRVEKHLEVKQILDALGWDKGEYSRKTRGLAPLYLGEVSILWEILGNGEPGWPFVTVEELRALAR